MSAVKELTEDDLHHVFEVECRGDTLILAPRGDAAGFPEGHFRSAVRLVHDRFERGGGRPRNLIIDLTGTEYPGLSMIGAFRDLIDTVKARGGTTAVAGISPSTDRVLGEFHVGEDWTVYPDLAQAIRGVVHESIGQRARRLRRPIAMAAAGLALIFLVAAVTRAMTRPDEAPAFRKLSEVWSQYKGLEAVPSDDGRREHVREGLASYANFLKRAYEGQRLSSAASTAARLEEIIRSPKQPHPRASEFEKDLNAKIASLEEPRDQLVTRRQRQLQEVGN